MMRIEVPDDIKVKTIITDKNKQMVGYVKAMMGHRQAGDCGTASLLRYKKLYEIGNKVGKTDGIKRVKGYRYFDLTFEDPNPHYWVENNGMVYDETCGSLSIYKDREQFYSLYKITQIEYSSFYCFFDTEFCDNEEDNKKMVELINSNQRALFRAIDMAIKNNEADEA
jgi:hypothetical protein